MQSKTRWIIMASMAISGAGVVAGPATAADKEGANATVSVGKFALPDGIAPKNHTDDRDIRKAFGDVVAAATKPNGYSDVVDCFVDQDRQRLGQYKEKDGDQLNQIVNKFRSDWKAKYGQEFDLNDKEKVKAFSGISILTGEIQTPDKLAGNWPVQQPASMSVGTNGAKLEDKAQPAASKQDVQRAKDQYFGGDVNLDKGRDVAVAKVPSAVGLPEIHCSLIQEHTAGWRFDVPNNMTSQQLHDNLVKHLTMVADHKDQWPSNIDEAYGVVAHHVIEAVYGIDTMANGSK